MHVNKQMDLGLHLYYAMTIKREIKRKLNQQPKIQSCTCNTFVRENEGFKNSALPRQEIERKICIKMSQMHLAQNLLVPSMRKMKRSTALKKVSAKILLLKSDKLTQSE